ncbi:MAG: hypothetical protein IPG56_10320 [Caulobacteraceae bacterium]|nr:hypothetical protein [Caulobacteraceae bacterium]
MTTFSRDQRNVDTRTSQRLRAHGFLQTLAEAETDWSKRWSNAVAELSLPPDVSIVRAEEVAREWTSARGELSNIAQTRRRIAQIDADEADLRQMTDLLAVALGVKVATDPVEAASELKAAWGAHQKHWREFSGLEPERRQAAEEEQRAAVDLETAECALNDICAEVGAAEADLEALAKRLTARDASADQHEQLIAKIRAAGDGFSIDELRQQCQGQDIDAIRADLEALDPERRRLDDLIKAAVETMQSGENQLKAFEDPTQVNQAVAERESAASEMHMIAEQWTEMTLARDILKEAISQVRAQHQDPLIARAGALFQLTTKGAFAGVAAEVDEDGAPVVVGRRTDGARVGIREMSDGARDQLFLSFRLASIERYGEAAESIAFIADDILVNFDDERGTATVELLAEFGKANQVILFTHHRSVRDAAAALLTKAPVQVIDLAKLGDSLGESQAA